MSLDEQWMRVADLKNRIAKATHDLRAAGFGIMLSLAELFATCRAAHLPVKIRQMWAALNALEPQEIGQIACSYASPMAVIAPLSDKCCAAAKKHGISSPEHNAARTELHNAMYGEGNDLESYNAAEILRRREAANVGY
jgi:adenine-specific DNA glycosylase